MGAGFSKFRLIRAWLGQWRDSFASLEAGRRKTLLVRFAMASGIAVAAALIFGLGAFHAAERGYDRLVAERFSDGSFSPASRAWSSETHITTGSKMSTDQLEDLLRRAGYRHDGELQPATFRTESNMVEWLPAGATDSVKATFDESGRVQVGAGKRGSSVDIGPTLLTSLSDTERDKRRLVTYDQIPPVLRDAILSIEDRRFFDHHGIDWLRTSKAAFSGLFSMSMPQGLSSITQQLARGVFLTREKTFQRKYKELFLARALERRLSKQQIFEAYVNQAYMGRSGAYNVAGMGEASVVYFGKPLSELRVEEAAVLAAMLKAPTSLDPRRFPERCAERRDLVLRSMESQGRLTPEETRRALAAKIELSENDVDSQAAPYFVDMARAEADRIIGADIFRAKAWDIHTSIDPQLQRAAVEAVRAGMAEVDKRLEDEGRKAADGSKAQCAVVVLDPKTGGIKALIGGRDYERTQLNRALARRQPGSTFKPFVVAAAMATGLTNSDDPPITPVSLLYDVPTIFEFGDELYEPHNYGRSTNGFVTVRDTLVRSLNVPAVLLAEKVGFKKVAQVARDFGLTGVKPTPSIALGAYETSLLELASAYSVFANNGRRAEPHFIEKISPATGEPVFVRGDKSEKVLDARVSHVVLTLLEDVMNHGTAAAARTRGFYPPAGGKTGTDDDGWFVGFTSELLCAVWVGFDDNSDLGLEGAKSALPIWTEFMKRAYAIEPYRRTQAFEAPEGVETANVDLAFLYPYSPGIKGVIKTAFITGTRPNGPQIVPIPPTPLESSPLSVDRAVNTAWRTDGPPLGRVVTLRAP